MPNILPFEREIIQAYDNGEKAVLAELTKLYEEALEKVNEKIAALMGRMGDNAQHVIYQVEYQKAVRTQIQAILEQLQADEFETISEYLTKSYEDGFVGAMYSLHNQGMPFIFPIDQVLVVKAIQHDTRLKSSLYSELGKDIAKLKKTISHEISRGLASNMLYPEITGNVSRAAGIPLRRARTIVRTEAGRIQEEATMDVGRKAVEAGADLVKQWSAYRDARTRKNHRLLDGQIREVEEPFELYGMTAMQPKGFGIASMDINCRCTTLLRPRSALDEAEYERLQDIARQHGLLVKDSKEYGHKKAKDFADFKKKYLKAAETLEKPEKSGIIKADEILEGHASTPPRAKPHMVIDHIGKKGFVNVRSFYGNDGMKHLDINTDDHGNPKMHPYGKHGEHAHDYEWGEGGRLKNKTTRELSKEERERNGDIL